jgi:ubiquitin carboxyl-terminal hydrolase 47
LLKEGEFVYELYAVLVHNGGAFGGHYFAYVRSGDKWFNFNDSQVKEIDSQEVVKTFGGEG